MKNKLWILITTVLLIPAVPGFGQMHMGTKQQREQGMMMMPGMMMRGMMQNMDWCPMCGNMMGGSMPMQKYNMMMHMLPNFQEALSFSTDQAEELIDLRASFKKQQVEEQADLAKENLELQNLLENGASKNQIKRQMQSCSKIRINMSLEAYDSLEEMKAVLTENQREQLQTIMNQHAGMMQTPGRSSMMNQ